ncbi:hypothetical protein SESBI_09295 [Sesbania bispinosa]|nr:hypothetical protein SESBI_09295 [Sesbania bispinosa]
MDPVFIVPHEDFILFHKIDRDLYRILVIHLLREPTECIQILGTWLWLERMGFRNMVKKILSLPNLLINEVADETLLCLSCVNNGLIIPSSSNGNETPLLQSLVDNEISLQFFHENRVQALQGVAKAVENVCDRAFTDITQQAIMIRNSIETRRMTEAQIVPVTQSSENPNAWFGSINVGLELQNNQVPADDRTLFVTFSRGYHVEEWEVRQFFTMAYGDCIEALHMQEVQPTEQSLYARVVFHKIGTIDLVLGGAYRVKFTISGKHMWARKFMPKRKITRDFLPSLPNLPGEPSGSAGL